MMETGPITQGREMTDAFNTAKLIFYSPHILQISTTPSWALRCTTGKTMQK